MPDTPMFKQAAVVAVRMALFRAGPQDFPYSPALTRVILPLTVVAAFLQYRLTLPGNQALICAVAWVAALAGFTYFLLQSRGLLNRLRQTLDSLYVIGSGMSLLMLAPLSVLAPQMVRIAENPELARSEPLAPLPALIVVALLMWNFFVTAHIYRHALNSQPGIGALVALLCAIVTTSVASAIGAALG